VGRVGHLSHAVTSWTGNDARVLEYSHRDLAVRALDDPVLASVADEGLPVAGPTMFLRRLLKSRGQVSPTDYSAARISYGDITRAHPAGEALTRTAERL